MFNNIEHLKVMFNKILKNPRDIIYKLSCIIKHKKRVLQYRLAQSIYIFIFVMKYVGAIDVDLFLTSKNIFLYQ